MPSAAVRKTMRANRSKNTKPELELRRRLWHAGLRGWRNHVSRLPGTPDTAWIGLKIAIFLNGCFWHGCPTCTANGRAPIPKDNHDYWAAKRQKTAERQSRQVAALESKGWTVCIIWECELRESPDAVVSRICQVVNGRRSSQF